MFNIMKEMVWIWKEIKQLCVAFIFYFYLEVWKPRIDFGKYANDFSWNSKTLVKIKDK